MLESIDESSCPICGEPTHRDADNMIERCPNLKIERSSLHETFLRDLGWFEP